MGRGTVTGRNRYPLEARCLLHQKRWISIKLRKRGRVPHFLRARQEEGLPWSRLGSRTVTAGPHRKHFMQRRLSAAPSWYNMDERPWDFSSRLCPWPGVKLVSFHVTSLEVTEPFSHSVRVRRIECEKSQGPPPSLGFSPGTISPVGPREMTRSTCIMCGRVRRGEQPPPKTAELDGSH